MNGSPTAQELKQSVDMAELAATESAASAAEAKKTAIAFQQFVMNFIDTADKVKQQAANKKKGKHIKDYLNDYAYFSGKASDINRSLAIAGLAIIWLLLKDTDAYVVTAAGKVEIVSSNLPRALFFPVLCLLLALTLDLLHYVTGSAIWGMFHREKMKEWDAGSITDEEASNVEAPAKKRGFVNFFFISKFLPTIVAYLLLILQLTNKIKLG